MKDKAEKENFLVISYMSLRKTIGLLGIAFPVVLALGGLLILKSPGIERSMSAYYYTGMLPLFVGTLWAIGFFLLSYKGYARPDAIAGDLGCIFAVGMTLFPTRPVMLQARPSLLDSSPDFRCAVLSDSHLFLAVFIYENRSEQDSLKEKATAEYSLQDMRLRHGRLHITYRCLLPGAEQRSVVPGVVSSCILAGGYSGCRFWSFMADQGRGNTGG